MKCRARNVDADERVWINMCAGCNEIGIDPLVSQDGESRVDPSLSGQHYPFGGDLFQRFVEKGDQAPG